LASAGEIRGCCQNEAFIAGNNRRLEKSVTLSCPLSMRPRPLLPHHRSRGRLGGDRRRRPAGRTEFPGGDEIDFQRKPAGDFARARKVSNERERASQKRNNTLGDAYAYHATRQVTGVQYDATTPDTPPTAPARTVAYAFDATGNRTLVTDNAIPTAYTANNLNQYTAIGADAPTHDTNGNLSSTGGWSYSYDAQNRLVGASNLTTTAAFAYDGRNRCVTRTINGTTTHYYFDAWNIIEEHNASGLQLAATAHGEEEDEPIFRWDVAGNLSYYHQDALGNITALTDTLGVPVEHYRYDIHGIPTISDVLNQPRATSFFGNRFLFTGREYLQDLALYDYRNRVYSPGLGRFLQTDPIGFRAKDVNLYRYVGNNFVNAVDAFGLAWTEVSGTAKFVKIWSITQKDWEKSGSNFQSLVTGVNVTWEATVSVKCKCGSKEKTAQGQRIFSKELTFDDGGVPAVDPNENPERIPTPKSWFEAIGEIISGGTPELIDPIFDPTNFALVNQAITSAKPQGANDGAWKNGSPCK